jgi:hypothetical protein
MGLIEASGREIQLLEGLISADSTLQTTEDPDERDVPIFGSRGPVGVAILEGCDRDPHVGSGAGGRAEELR